MKIVSTSRRAQDTRRYCTDVVGNSEASSTALVSTGEMLGRIDSFAALIGGAYCLCNLVTLSFDRVDVLHPIFNGDLVRLEGQIIHVGRSSMTIEIGCFRFDRYSRAFVRTHNALVTMVAIDKEGRPKKDLPGLNNPSDPVGCARLRQKALERQQLAKKWSEMQESVDQMSDLKACDVDEEENRSKDQHIPMADSTIEVGKQFLPRNENINRTIFGGDLLEWMEKIALYCARDFTRSQDMITIGMNRIFFKRPIYCLNVVSMKARVCHVRRYTLEVEVTVYTQAWNNNEITDKEKSHTGFFTAFHYGKGGKKKRIPKGLLLTDSDVEGLKYSILVLT